MNPPRRDGRLRTVKRPLQRWVGWLCYRTYPTAKLYHRFLLRFSPRRKGVPILVYQMGKVASQTVVETLDQAGIASPVFHLHVLDDQAIADDERRRRAHWTRDGTVNHLWTSQHVKRRLASEPQGMWRIVTLVRDPIARNVSMFFQVTHRWIAADEQRRSYRTDPSSFLDELRRRFLEDFDGHDFPDLWFDAELGRFFGIDVYESPFPTSRGYALYENERARVLVIRVEDLRACAGDAFKTFFGIDIGETLQEANIADNKHYADVYRQFVESVELPLPYIARMYDSRYARHFYTEDELDAFRRRWIRSHS